jgi:hypothetical protein
MRFRVLSFIVIDSIFHFISEMPDETLYWPCCCVTQSTDGVTFDLKGKFLKHVDFTEVGISILNSLKQVSHPVDSFSAWSALSTRLMLIEF